MVRARFHLWETGSTAQMVDTLGSLRGSHGVVLNAQDEPEVAEAVDSLVEGAVPVVTYATDLPGNSRCAYVGIDNQGTQSPLAWSSRPIQAGCRNRPVYCRYSTRRPGRALLASLVSSSGCCRVLKLAKTPALSMHTNVALARGHADDHCRANLSRSGTTTRPWTRRTTWSMNRAKPGSLANLLLPFP